jgi:hypothetical protein
MRFHYAGHIRIVERAANERRAVLEAEGQETRGEGSAKARVAMIVTAINRGSLVSVETDLHVLGGLAQMGRGMIEEVAGELLDDFAICLERTMREKGDSERLGAAAPVAHGPAAPVNGLRVLVRLIQRRIGRLFGRKR